MPQIFTWTAAVFYAILPAIFWLIIWYKKDSLQPEPKTMILRAFFLGMLGVLPFFGIQFMLQDSSHLISLWEILQTKYFLLSTFFFVLVLAGLEEFFKHFSVVCMGRKLDIYFDQIVDGIVYSVSAALGFAFMENVVYFANALMLDGISPSFLRIFIFRSFGTMLGHTIFSGIFGYFWGHARLSHTVCKKERRMHFPHWHNALQTLELHIIFHHILHHHSTKTHHHRRRDLVREAFFLATFVHTVFNLLIIFEIFGTTLTPLIAPFLLLGFLYLSHQFLIKQNIKIWKIPKPKRV